MTTDVCLSFKVLLRTAACESGLRRNYCRLPLHSTGDPIFFMQNAHPDFFIAGAPEAGTTSLYHYLDQHPQIYMSPIATAPSRRSSGLCRSGSGALCIALLAAKPVRSRFLLGIARFLSTTIVPISRASLRSFAVTLAPGRTPSKEIALCFKMGHSSTAHTLRHTCSAG